RAAPFAYAPLPHLDRSALDRAPAGRAIDAALARETGRAIARAHAARLAVAPVAPASSPLGRRAVCVRLCDGYHFPLGAVRDAVDAKAQGAMCGQLCPGAPTRLFVLPEGSEKIDQAVSLDGRRYSALPVAFRHATTRDPTCGCRRPGRETQPIMSVLEDLTLRRGDTVMTGEGVRVFKGATRWPLRRNDFAAVGAISLPKEMRSKLVSLDRAARKPPPQRALPEIAQSPVRPAVTRHLGPAMAGKQVRLVAPVPGFALVQ
ncbi:MAG: DUF2865 domain-containing protein, partial [Methylobacteriaceae bacterium]|nr:DUF2865 domain-containing protein [Methylobacteriaceae bacterium]